MMPGNAPPDTLECESMGGRREGSTTKEGPGGRMEVRPLLAVVACLPGRPLGDHTER